MNDATAMFKQRGANVGPINVSGTKAILSNIVDPNGVRTELVEITPDSLHQRTPLIVGSREEVELLSRFARQ